MKIISFLFLLLILPAQITAQVTEEWVARYSGPGNQPDEATSITIDKLGNIIVTGRSYLVGTSIDFLTVKYDSDGDSLWVKRYNGPGNGEDNPSAIAVDNEGNVYVTGHSRGDGTFSDYATIKYDSIGNPIWIQRYNGPDNNDDGASSLVIDNEGNVFVSGYSIVSGSGKDYATVKYNSEGIQQWVTRYNGPGNNSDEVRAIAVDNEGNLYVTGYSSGIGVVNCTTIKYDSNGDSLWVKRFGGPGNDWDEGTSISVDSQGNVYVSGSGVGNGTFYDFITIKYNSDGVQQWVKRYNGPNGIDESTSIALDSLGNIYVSGKSYGVGTDRDFVTIKYNPNGDLLWVERYNGTENGEDLPKGIEVDSEGSVYVTGYSIGFGTGQDYTTIKYDSNGNSLWVKKYAGPGNNSDRASSIGIDNFGNIYISGNSGQDYATIKYSQTSPLQITKPTPYSKFIAGETDTIKWTDAGWAAVNIKCITNFETPLESELILAQGIPHANSKFVWNVLDTTLSFRSKIIIENADNPTEKIESDIFRIKPYVLTRLNSDSTYYEYRKNRDQWGFRNDSTNMWPDTWFNQFNYLGTDPFTNMQYSRTQGDSTFNKAFLNDHSDWISWVNTFTVDACYFSAMNGWYKPSAVIKWRSKSDIWNGSCFGIAAANALAFSHREQFQTKYQNFPAFINPITVVSDTGVKRVVNELFTYQYGNPTQANDPSALAKTPNQTLNEIRQMLLEDSAQVRTLSIYNNGGDGGHTILAYGLKQDPVQKNLFRVQVYDNSNPNSNNPINIDTLANGGKGSWSTPDWAGWGGNGKIHLEIPSIQYLNGATFPARSIQQSAFILPQNVLEINYPNDTQIRIIDNLGNITGHVYNLALNEIPGSLPQMIRNGSETPPYGYSLPTDNYSVVLNNFAEDIVETFFFSGNKSFVYERSGATQTQTDRLFFDGGVSAANPDAQTKTIKLLNLINETTQEKLFVARSLELAQNDSVKIENPDSNKVKLISYGTAKEYDLELNYVTENGIGRFGDFDVQLEANTSHTFVPVWTNLTNTELKVLVDIGNDGSIDDTLSLVNQVTGIGEDQGSLLTPNSYNLAQNYPNPFNPSTKISWQSPVGSHQTLKVYDILGNEVATLVDEFRNAGRYEVTFDASTLSSGIYFYRLQAGSFVETKKMILLR